MRAQVVDDGYDWEGEAPLHIPLQHPGFRWAEWNGRYRDLIRAFVRGEKGLIGEVATPIAGSHDLYGSRGRLPINTANCATCHSAFTFHDLVSYARKHNESTGQDNRDGNDHSLNRNPRRNAARSASSRPSAGRPRT